MPGPVAVAVQLIGIVGPLKVPPFGAVTATVGWARSRGAVAVVSRPVGSKAKYARRAGAPPQAPAPAVPFAAEETHRNPTGWFLVQPWTTLLSVPARGE